MTIRDLNQRSIQIFKELVESYVETGEPVGSRTISRRISTPLSPATIRNIMADLEEAGLLYSPHTSAGRLPTEHGLRYFVHGLLEVGDLSKDDRDRVEAMCHTQGKSVEEVLESATNCLSGLSQCAGIVMAPKGDAPLKHVEFVYLSPGKALAVMISQDGMVENRLVDIPDTIHASVLSDASRYLSAVIHGKTLEDAMTHVVSELSQDKTQLDALTNKVVEAGLAVWSGGEKSHGSLIVKGQANLLNSVNEIQELEKIRELFDVLEAKESLQHLLDASIKAEGVQIFIGSENNLFSLSGCSLVIAPYHNAQQKIIGAIGVVGPARMNYGKIIPLVDYTAKLVGRMIG
jgi:heat-inducible transcriptional repressor